VSERKIAPQSGPQRQFAETRADIAIYGGAAGGGKSFGLILEPLRSIRNKDFGAVIFRKHSTEVRNEGGLWTESSRLYPLLGARPRQDILEWTFPSGARVRFAHLEHEKSVYSWQGGQIPLICFDELTHFSENQFFYMLSRNRSTIGIPAYIRATCNPDPDSWVRRFVDWWIGEDGFPIPERSGKLRWFVRIGDAIEWADSREDIIARYGVSDEIQPLSVTFIGAKLSDNPILIQKDKKYLANLLAMNRVDRARLKDGNWNIRECAGAMFSREWFPIVEAIPGGFVRCVRFWDRAATPPHSGNRDPDWTRGLKLYKYPDGSFVVGDLRSARESPGKIEQLILNTASHDGRGVRVVSQQDPGSAGVSEAEHFIKMLAGYDVRTFVTSKDKVTRSKPVSAQCEAGNIKIMRAPWNEAFFQELENFPDGAHDDIVDVLSGAFNECSGGLSILDVL
jgi:predicted phage terminase large subunit-like protein